MPQKRINMTDEFLYEVKGVSYSYLNRFPALADINLKIKKGERLVLLGANGSGKSTLLMLLAGLLFPGKGSVKFSGKELTEESLTDKAFQRSFRSSVGIVFQNPDIQLFNSNVEDEVLFGLNQLGLPAPAKAGRVEKYLSLMEIGNLRNRHPQYLSLGEKKRVAVASVFAMEPQALLLDEPTAGLDPRTSRHLIDAVIAFADRGGTVITATQDIHIVLEISDRVVVLGENKMVSRDGAAGEVFNDRRFLEANNLVHVHAHGHKNMVHVHPHEHPSHDHPHPRD